MADTHIHVPGADPLNEACPIREVLDRIGDKWTNMVIIQLGRRTRRFNELHREVAGISQRMLALTLRGLVRDGLVLRTVHPTVPPRVDYELTELGRTLLPPIMSLHEWAVLHRDDIRHARARHDSAGDAHAAQRFEG